MSQYLVLSKINIQNANSIAGLTWGFPAITNFLGFTHALNRKISNLDYVETLGKIPDLYALAYKLFINDETQEAG